MGLFSSQAWEGSTPPTNTGSALSPPIHTLYSDDNHSIRTAVDHQQSHRPSFQSFHQATTRSISVSPSPPAFPPQQAQRRFLDPQKPPVFPVPIGEPSQTSGPASFTSSLRSENASKVSLPRSFGEKATEVVEPPSTARHPSIGSQEKENELMRTASTATASTDAGAPGEDDESKYPKSFALATLTFGLIMALFMVALDKSVLSYQPLNVFQYTDSF